LLMSQEFLQVFDVPAALTQPLSADKRVHSLLLRNLSPLIVSSIFITMWPGLGGGSLRNPTKVALSRPATALICTWKARQRCKEHASLTHVMWCETRALRIGQETALR
jgi:hypothetical protein